jgi:hypothetical protein
MNHGKRRISNFGLASHIERPRIVQTYETGLGNVDAIRLSPPKITAPISCGNGSERGMHWSNRELLTTISNPGARAEGDSNPPGDRNSHNLCDSRRITHFPEWTEFPMLRQSA